MRLSFFPACRGTGSVTVEGEVPGIWNTCFDVWEVTVNEDVPDIWNPGNNLRSPNANLLNTSHPRPFSLVACYCQLCYYDSVVLSFEPAQPLPQKPVLHAHQHRGVGHRLSQRTAGVNVRLR